VWSNYAGSNYALLWNANINIKNSRFSNNTAGIQHDAAGTFTYDNLQFAGSNGTTLFDIKFTAAGTLTINAANGSNPTSGNSTTTGGGTIVVQNTKTFTVTNIIDGTEIRIYRQSDLTELAGAENVGASPSGLSNITVGSDPDNAGRYTAQYTYNYTGDIPVYVVAHNVDYKWIRPTAVLRSENGSLQISQEFDRQYANP